MVRLSDGTQHGYRDLTEQQPDDCAADDVGPMVNADERTAQADDRGQREPGWSRRETAPIGEDGCRKECGRGVPAGEAAGRRLSNWIARIARNCWSLATKEPLDSLIDNQALGADQRREHERLIGMGIAGETAHGSEQVPDQAEVAELARRVKHAIGNTIAAKAFESRIGPVVERRHLHAAASDPNRIGASTAASDGSPPKAGHHG